MLSDAKTGADNSSDYDGTVEDLKARHGQYRTLVVDLERPNGPLHVAGAEVVQPISYETDRARFIGRGRSTVLPAALDAHADGHLLVDCRSSSYAAAWSPAADRTVVVNVFQERNGKRTVVSHFAKHTRGELARHLLTRRCKAPETPTNLLKAAQEKWQAELVAGTARKPHALNIILPG